MAEEETNPQDIIAWLIAKAWQDDAFKQALLNNPRATIENEGIEVPEGMEVVVVEQTENRIVLVLPPAPEGDLSEEQLDAVSGGQDHGSHPALSPSGCKRPRFNCGGCGSGSGSGQFVSPR